MNTTIKDVDYVKLVKDLIYNRFKTPYEEKINKNGIINSLSRVKINGVLLVDILNEGYKFSETNLPLKELVYLVLHNEFGERPKCTQCNIKSAKFRNINEGYRKTCGIECIKKYSKNLISNLNIKENIDKTNVFDESERAILEPVLLKEPLQKKSLYERTMAKYNTKYDYDNITQSNSETKFYEYFCEQINEIKDLIEFIKLKQNPRGAIYFNDKDIDILISTTLVLLAIEINGPAFHSSNIKKNDDYHKQKSLEFIESNSDESNQRLARILHIPTLYTLDIWSQKLEEYVPRFNKKIIMKKISSILDLTGLIHKINLKYNLYPKKEEYNYMDINYKKPMDKSIKIKDSIFIDKININNTRYKKSFVKWKRDFDKEETNWYYGINKDKFFNSDKNFIENSIQRMFEEPEYFCLSIFLDGYRPSSGKNCYFEPFSTAQYKVENNCAIIERMFNIEEVNVLDESSLSLISKKLKYDPEYNMDEVYIIINNDFEDFSDPMFNDSLGCLIDLDSIEDLPTREYIFHKNIKKEYSYTKTYHNENDLKDFSYNIEIIENDKNGGGRTKTIVTIHDTVMRSENCDYLAMFNSGYKKARVIR